MTTAAINIWKAACERLRCILRANIDPATLRCSAVVSEVVLCPINISLHKIPWGGALVWRLSEGTGTKYLCSTFLYALSEVAADFVNSAGAYTNIHILNESTQILMCKSSLGFFFFIYFFFNSRNFNRWAIGSLVGVLVCLFLQRGRWKQTEGEKGRPVFRTLNTRNVVCAWGDR